MLQVVSSQPLSRFLRCATVLAKLLSIGALSAACAVDEPKQAPALPREHVASASEAVTGADGSFTVTAAGTVVNRYTALAVSAAQNATSIQVASAAALSVGADALGVGDLLLIAQMQGATINTATNDVTWGSVTALNGAGLYELVEVLAVNGNVITLSCGLKHAYDKDAHTQVVRVPQYTTLTVAAGGSITAPAWNGTVGGIVAVHAQNTINLAGDIDVSGLGFRGGAADDNSMNAGTDVTIYASPVDADGARKGEGIAGLLEQFGRAPAANGGGGGNSHNGGGGGGANARFGAAWTGQGVFDLTTKGGGSAWLLDPNYSPKGSEGGGRGGYTYSSDDENALTRAPGKAQWGGNSRRQRGGLGGHPLDNDPSSRLFFGGGGGAGDANNGHGGNGGSGGGMVVLVASGVGGSGRILANGAAGQNANSVATGSPSGDAPGGGGGGGTVVVRATTVTGIAIQAHGGKGGSQIIDNGDEGEGPGGGGGGGFVSVSGSPSSVDVDGGDNGTTDSPALTEFPANGATDGSPGQALVGAQAVGAVPYCSDSTAPDTTLSGPTGSTKDTTADFTFSSNDNTATFECSLDGAAYAACTSPLTTAMLAEGPHTFSVRAKDTVGNVDATPASITWTIDTTAPDTTISSGPSGVSGSATGQFGFTSPDNTATFECKLDDGAFTACTSPFSTGALSEGQHTFSVRAKDAAGNVDATPATRTWTIDATAPDTAITGGPSGVSTSATGAFSFASPDATATFECKLDTSDFTACTTPFNTGALTDGAHTFSVRAKDPAGNVDATPATRSWTIDATAPDTAITGGPSGVSTSATGAFSFASPDATATFECKLDTSDFTACTTPFNTGALTDGAHTFSVRAKDPAGNVDTTPAGVTWTIDTTAPDVAITGGPSGLTASISAVFSFSSSDSGATFECNLDGAALFTACSSPSSVENLSQGPHTFSVQAKDAAGNVSTAVTRTWTVDTVPPETELLTGPDASTTQTTASFTFSSDDNGASFECKIDSADFVACTSGFTTPVLSPGEHTFQVRAKDAANNVDATPATQTWTITALDSDGDGLSDDDEDALGTDKNDADTDDDGVPDGQEVDPSADTDGDGLINALDPDSDNDGLFDGTELGLDCSDDGTDLSRGLCRPDADAGATKTSPVNPDTDGGGVSDGSEDFNLDGKIDDGETDPTDGNGADDTSVVDSDGDGLSDGLEGTLGSDPNDKDSDDDGVPDGAEPNPSADSDGDGLVNVIDVDSDNDGLFDGTELGRDCSGDGTDEARGHCRADADPSTTTSAVNPDTDFGGVSDGNEDHNLDGKLDDGETDPTAGQDADDGIMDDADQDGISDGTEEHLGSDPNDADSDDDGLLDGEEPNFSDDSDGDGTINLLDSDSDDDGLFDGTEAGKDCANSATDEGASQCVADADPGTTTSVLLADTDGGGVSDGEEDANQNGAVDSGERDPLNPADDNPTTGEGGAGGMAGEAGSGGAGAETGEAGSGGEGIAGEANAGAGGETAGAGGTAGSGGTPASGGTPSSGGTAGSEGQSGGTSNGGTTGTGGTTEGGGNGTAGSTNPDRVVVLGGGLCSYRPATNTNGLALLAASGLMAACVRRRRNRR